jgi:pilus assembly protein Flp/PilA
MIAKLYVKAANFLTEFKNDERGVTAIEYGLIGVAMAVLLAAVFNTTDGGILGNLEDAYDAIATSISSVYTAPPPGSGS